MQQQGSKVFLTNRMIYENFNLWTLDADLNDDNASYTVKFPYSLCSMLIQNITVEKQRITTVYTLSKDHDILLQLSVTVVCAVRSCSLKLQYWNRGMFHDSTKRSGWPSGLSIWL